MIVAAHQPDLLPYTGFFHKMALSDAFVLLPYDQFQKHGYQRRVMMRGSWCSHHLVGKPSLVPINYVRVQADWQEHLVNVIRGRYTGSRFWRERGEFLCYAIQHLLPHGERSLDEVNSALIRLMRNLLGIQNDLYLADPSNTLSSTERVIEHVRAIGGTAYLAGIGSKAYMDDAERKFDEAGITLIWSQHEHRSPDSILTAYFDEEDPMDAVMQVHLP